MTYASANALFSVAFGACLCGHQGCLAVGSDGLGTGPGLLLHPILSIYPLRNTYFPREGNTWPFESWVLSLSLQSIPNLNLFFIVIKIPWTCNTKIPVLYSSHNSK